MFSTLLAPISPAGKFFEGISGVNKYMLVTVANNDSNL
jgi:hypothetical protein